MNSSLEENKTYPKLSPLEFGVAGAVSSFLTRAIFQPLDVLKIRFQLQVESTRKNKGGLYHGVFQATKTIYKQEGITSLWKGHASAQVLTVTYGLGQFWSFSFFKKQASNFGFKDNGMILSVCGGLAGMVGTLISMPFDVARTRIVAQGISEYSGMVDVWRKILLKENVFGLWRGLTPTLLMTVPFAAIQFQIYYFLSDLMSSEVFRDLNIVGLKTSTPAFCGAVSGVTAKMAVYPLDVLKKRMQIRGSEEVRQRFGKVVVYRNMWHCIRSMTVEEGALAWFKGLKPSLIKSACFSSFVFALYELSCEGIAASKYYSSREDR